MIPQCAQRPMSLMERLFCVAALAAFCIAPATAALKSYIYCTASGLPMVNNALLRECEHCGTWFQVQSDDLQMPHCRKCN